MTLSGTVVRDGAPVTGVAVTVSVAGNDLVAAAVTDEDGAFVVELEAAIGDEVRVSAKGQTFTSAPDRNGCVRTETPVGRSTVTIDRPAGPARRGGPGPADHQHGLQRDRDPARDPARHAALDRR